MNKFQKREALQYLNSISSYAIRTKRKKKTNYLNNPFEGINSEEGQMMILWRSFISQGYYQLNRADNRKTLSFNVMPIKLSNGGYSFLQKIVNSAITATYL